MSKSKAKRVTIEPKGGHKKPAAKPEPKPEVKEDATINNS